MLLAELVRGEKLGERVLGSPGGVEAMRPKDGVILKGTCGSSKGRVSMYFLSLVHRNVQSRLGDGGKGRLSVKRSKSWSWKERKKHSKL